ncbi:MAG: hypothetical protein A2469_00545 [Candidatus Magasanikbacteria bacterium RIFOXYC2_FULL_40_16]|uniref:Uncharacterized protein n=1 Tax=Candidatus Magasanikbacteria bacterium RIFOXYC2_FULL_40_16 TaxID=1798703 RepID=A0A1F6P1R0_9BACT|nr:MAG: hypothetical protein A2469_00545 [Candidatus Magasanikbacteria bacterium RIFOXYC2_FULL_40_16]
MKFYANMYGTVSNLTNTATKGKGNANHDSERDLQAKQGGRGDAQGRRVDKPAWMPRLFGWSHVP